MRIWCQSAGAFGKDAIWDPYGQSLRRHIRKVVRPDTVVDLYGTDFTTPGRGAHQSAFLITQLQVIRNAMRAQAEGYDAFLLLTTNDTGSSEIRELVRIPVIFTTETCLNLAGLLADKFAIITNNEIELVRITQIAGRYGMGPRMVPGGHLGLRRHSEIRETLRNGERYVEPVLKNVKPGALSQWSIGEDFTESVIRLVREIGDRGANLLYPAPGALTQWLVDNKLNEIDGIVILDAVGAALKMAELMVDLKAIGINRSPRYYSTPQPEILAALKKVYDGFKPA